MSVQYITVDASSDDQRVDNFLLRQLKGVPKSRIYRALRSGEVRVNKKRVKPSYRLKLNDIVRIPPITVASRRDIQPPSDKLAETIAQSIIFEDSHCMVINKPSGMPVHGGSGFNAGLIELLRLVRSDCGGLELVHRLDKATSGCLLIAKTRDFLRHCHHLLTSRQIHKQYHALVMGVWQGGERKVEVPLLKSEHQSGEHRVVVADDGKPATTVFIPLKQYARATLVAAYPVTGRTHQIRVHAAYMGHPIACDEKYGDRSFNQYIKSLGLKRLFLHAASLDFPPLQGQKPFHISAPLTSELEELLAALN